MLITKQTMNRSVSRRLLTLLVWVSLVSTVRAQDDIITPCGPCTCNMRQASADCSDRQLHNLPADLPVNITHLNLARNRIRSSGEDQLRLCQKYPDLQEVSLAWNGMRTLSTLLHGCDHLEQLDLTGNILEAVPPTVFTDVHNLQALTSLELQELDATMFHGLKRLESLRLTFHGLTLQPGVFRELSSLRSLTLALEKALRLPERLFSVTEGNVLQQLTLKGSKVKDIPDDLFRELVNLKELHLDLPHVLQLSMNTQDQHKHLQLLEVSNVRSLAEDVLSGLNALQVVIFRGVSHLAGQRLFHTAAAVKELEIVECSLSQLPPGWLDNMLALETLNLSDNRLEELTPSDFIHLTALKHLVLSNNKIQDLPAGVFSAFKSTLQQLLLNDNQLRHLAADTFTDMQMLEVLDLRRNMINNISAHSLRNLPRLKILKLSGNYISALDHVLFDSLPKLEELDLSENMIWQFPATLLALNLSQLLLSANNLNRVPGEQLCHMSGLQALALDDNPVWCDCSLRMLHQCLPRLLLSGICSTPAGMEGQSIAEIPECAAAISAFTSSTWLAETSGLEPPSSPVVFWLEPTLARLPDLDTWSPLLAASTFIGHSQTPLASSVAPSLTEVSPSASASLTAVILPSATASLTAVISSSATASWMTPTQLSPSSHWLSSRVSVTLLLSSSWTPELTPEVSASSPADLFTENSGHSQPLLLATSDTINPALFTSYPTLGVSASTTRHEMTSTQTVAGHHSQLSAMAASRTHSHDPMEDLDLDYDAYIEHEIVRPLVAAGVLERHDQLPAIPDTDPLAATQLAQSSVVSTYVDVPNSPAVDTQPDSFSIIDMPQAAITDAPARPDNHSEPLSPQVAQVHAEPDTEEISEIISVAGEIAVAMFFSLAIVLSILSGILLYRKYFRAGSYIAASPSTDPQPHHLVHMQPLDADVSSLSASTTAIASDLQPAPRQVPV